MCLMANKELIEGKKGSSAISEIGGGENLGQGNRFASSKDPVRKKKERESLLEKGVDKKIDSENQQRGLGVLREEKMRGGVLRGAS